MKKITIGDVRKIKVGQKKVFRFETAIACKSMQQRALQDARLRAYKIETICDIDHMRLTITRTA